ncbi:hypothetical protein BC833DRAFT_645047 [Globomyces pollinis-pini]|nr:hypothetical protein BC833DRAFT_645047 [Globomyces pollinis-pini]
MVVTTKKRKFNAKADSNDIQATINDFGQKYHCDNCTKDITHLIILRCAICPDFDLCLECFLKGAEPEGKGHLKSHDYRVIDVLDFPMFEGDWGADEELLLVEGLELFGIGNWEHISEHIGTKNSKQCEEHYDRIFVQSKSWPYPDMESKFDMTPGKRSRARPPGYTVTKLPKWPRAPASQPVNHEIAGFMPGRKEFEQDFENDAEQIVKDIEFTEDDTKEETDLKCAVLDIYNSVLDKRTKRKKFVFDRGLTDDFRKIQTIEKKRPKEERDLYVKYRVFAKMQTPSDFEEFMDGMINEMKLRTKIAQLQEYLRMGIKTTKESIDYEKDKTSRINGKAAGFSYTTAAERSAPRRGITRVDTPTSSAVSTPNRTIQSLPPTSLLPAATGSRKAANPLDISNTEGVELLSDPEKNLCANLRLFPMAYMAIKDTIIKEYSLKGPLKRRAIRSLIKIDVNKTTRLFDFFLEMGWITKA